MQGAFSLGIGLFEPREDSLRAQVSGAPCHDFLDFCCEDNFVGFSFFELSEAVLSDVSVDFPPDSAVDDVDSVFDSFEESPPSALPFLA